MTTRRFTEAFRLRARQQLLLGRGHRRLPDRGLTDADGAGRCIWQEFSHTPGTTYDGQTGDLACDHYHRFAEDIELMRNLGLGAYRSPSDGLGPARRGRRAESGGARLLRPSPRRGVGRGLEPFVTLFHWDFPSALQRRGGWPNRDSADWFGEYASVVAAALGDRVRWWTTLNEPFVVAEQGHLVGAHAPGIRNIYAAGHAIHNQLRAHVAAWTALKAANPEASVGIALHNAAVWPASEFRSRHSRHRGRTTLGTTSHFSWNRSCTGDTPLSWSHVCGPTAERL